LQRCNVGVGVSESGDGRDGEKTRGCQSVNMTDEALGVSKCVGIWSEHGETSGLGEVLAPADFIPHGAGGNWWMAGVAGSRPCPLVANS
jgi:hypothetical protein